MILSLEDRLREASSRLTDRVLAEMYRDPWWQSRFGARGRQHARTDGDFHLKYVIESLAVGDLELFATYARWLRDLLLSHGMCSWHLADNFDRLAVAIADERWPDGHRAVAVLGHGSRALRHVAGEAAALDDARDKLAARAAAITPRVSVGELKTLLSFLADAVAAGQRQRLLGYTTHLRGQGRGLDVEAALAAVTAALGEHLPSAECAAAFVASARTPVPAGGP